MSRTDSADRQEDYDLIVIGAGINGAGIARDAALRGLRVLLVERSDIGGATSAWNSRLIHGGLRYLEHGEIGLVRESLREREVLLRTAPHLVQPLPLLVPLYRDARRSRRLVHLGMLAYDVLSYDKSLPWHRRYSARQLRRLEPGLNRDGLLGAALYHDAQAPFPERLVLENVLDARALGADVRTYTRARRVLIEDFTHRARGVELETPAGTIEQAYADAVINVAGPWVDELLGASGNGFERRIGGTKGTHIVVDPFPGAPRHALYAEAAADGRPYFTIPWNGRYLIGTTDTRYEADPGEAAPEDAEIDYLLAETNRLLPEAGLRRADVLSAYAGVRPLPHAEAGTTAAITRRHVIVDHAPQAEGLWSVVGGKLTTYRHLAEEAVTQVGHRLDWQLPASGTRSRPLPGAAGEPWRELRRRFEARHQLPPELAERLVGLYGTRAEAIARRMRTDPELGEVFSPATGAIAAELVHAFEAEAAQTLADALLRRTMVGLGPEAGLDALDGAARIAERWLGWDPERIEDEREGYLAEIARLHPRALAGG